MKTFGDLIDHFGGAAKMAAEIPGIEANTIRQWSARGSIPARYWRAIVDAATRLGIEGVTFEVLGMIAADQAEPARVA